MENKNNKNKKQEAIRLAYGEYWGYVKNFVDENGWHNWFESKTNINIDNLEFETSNDGFKLRPKSLQGIENNAGWISIESEEDLPEKEFYKGYETFPINFRCNSYGLHKYYKSKEITHYQPIQKPQPPIF